MRSSKILTFVCALGLGACATTRDVPRFDPVSVQEYAVDLETTRVWDGRTGALLTPDEVSSRLAAAQVVLVGEEHGDPDFHATQLQVIRRAREQGYRFVGVEWLPWHRRAAVRALAGQPPEVTLPHVYGELDWPNTWGHDFAAYAPVIAWSLEHMVLEPLNARRELSRAVARGGREAVPAALAPELPPLDSGTEAHQRWFAEKMGGHGHGHGHALAPDVLARYYLAQLVWDETMALNTRTVAAAGKVVVLAGLGHTERGLGIPARLGELTRLVVRPVADEAEALSRARDAEFPEREADLLWAYPRSTNTASR